MLGKLISHAKKTYGLHCDGSGFAAPFKIQKFLLSFEYNKQINCEEARKLIISLTEDLIKIANSDPIIIENLEHAPFIEKNLFYLITFPCNGEDLTGISLSNGVIYYHANQPPKKYCEVRSETYEESYYQATSCKLLRE
jgi:hypothetical protein